MELRVFNPAAFAVKEQGIFILSWAWVPDKYVLFGSIEWSVGEPSEASSTQGCISTDSEL